MLTLKLSSAGPPPARNGAQLAAPLSKINAMGVKPEKGRIPLKFPKSCPADHAGRTFAGGSVSFGQVVQPGSPCNSVEFTYIVAATILIKPLGSGGC